MANGEVGVLGNGIGGDAAAVLRSLAIFLNH